MNEELQTLLEIYTKNALTNAEITGQKSRWLVAVVDGKEIIVEAS